MDYTLLKSEIRKPEYAGLSDREISEKLQAKTVLSADGKLVPVSDVWLALARLGALPVIKKASEDVNSPFHKECYAVMSFLLGPVASFNLKDPMTISLADALEAAGVLSKKQKEALVGMSDKYVSRAEELGLETVAYWDVARARAL